MMSHPRERCLFIALVVASVLGIIFFGTTLYYKGKSGCPDNTPNTTTATPPTTSTTATPPTTSTTAPPPTKTTPVPSTSPTTSTTSPTTTTTNKPITTSQPTITTTATPTPLFSSLKSTVKYNQSTEKTSQLLLLNKEHEVTAGERGYDNQKPGRNNIASSKTTFEVENISKDDHWS